MRNQYIIDPHIGIKPHTSNIKDQVSSTVFKFQSTEIYLLLQSIKAISNALRSLHRTHVALKAKVT